MEYEEFKDKFDKLLSMSKYNWVILNNTNSTIKANNYKKCSNNGVEDIIRLYYTHNLVAYLDLDDIKEIV